MTTHQLLARLDLERAQTVFIEIVGIDLLNAQGSIAVAAPATTEIELVVDSAYAIVTREGQTKGIVLAIAGIGELHLSQNGRKESTRST